MSFRRLLGLGMASWTVLVLSGTVLAQETNLSGTVTDATDAVLMPRKRTCLAR